LRPVLKRSRHGGAGGVEVLAGRKPWMHRDLEQVGEVALREFGTKIGAVAYLLEQVRVGVEPHARSRVTEDAADLNDVEALLDRRCVERGRGKSYELRLLGHPLNVLARLREHPLA
jgi:hypothetical protein